MFFKPTFPLPGLRANFVQSEVFVQMLMKLSIASQYIKLHLDRYVQQKTVFGSKMLCSRNECFYSS